MTAEDWVSGGNYQRLDDPGIQRLISLTHLEEDEMLTSRFPAAQDAEVRVRIEMGRS